MRGAGKRDNGDLEASVFAGFLSTVLPVPSHVGKMPGSVATEESGRQTRGTPLAVDYPLQDLRKKKYKSKCLHDTLLAIDLYQWLQCTVVWTVHVLKYFTASKLATFI